MEIQTEFAARFGVLRTHSPKGLSLPDSSHCSACLPGVPEMARNECVNRDLSTSARSRRASGTWPTPLGAAIAPTAHAVRALANERRRGWVERAGACAPRAPMWTSGSGWLDGLRHWAQSPALGQLCAEGRVSMTAATLLSIAAVMAEHADHATGRHVAVTRATIASRVGCDVRTVTAAWRVLRVSQWAVEAQRAHGSPAPPASAAGAYEEQMMADWTRRTFLDGASPCRARAGALQHR